MQESGPTTEDGDTDKPPTTTAAAAAALPPAIPDAMDIEEDEDEDSAALQAAMAMSMANPVVEPTTESEEATPPETAGIGLPPDFRGRYELFAVVTHLVRAHGCLLCVSNSID